MIVVTLFYITFLIAELGTNKQFWRMAKEAMAGECSVIDKEKAYTSFSILVLENNVLLTLKNTGNSDDYYIYETLADDTFDTTVYIDKENRQVLEQF